MRNINIMKVELLWNDNNKQESLIFESVAVIRINLHLAREHLATQRMHGHEDPTSGSCSR
jgi:hypothetical protein